MIEPDLAKRIRLVGMDVDGTLTDGGLYLGAGPSGERIELKRFDIQDGMGSKLLQRSGVMVALVTGRGGDAARLRAEELKVDDFVASGGRKLPAFAAVLEKHGIAWEEAAFVGDDLIDIPILRRVALPVAVANAVAEVKACARHVTAAAGGHGALREFAEVLLRARGCWNDTVRAYLVERGDDAAV